MPYSLNDKLVIGLASSALFDLEESDRVFREEGAEVYQNYQRENQDNPLEKGVAFNFIKRLLSLNDLQPQSPWVEVVLLSKNSPDTGLRVMNSIEHWDLDISRALFLEGASPYPYFPKLNIVLFLSGNEDDVADAIQAGYAAGQVLPSKVIEEDEGNELRIAFDFDGVIADDSAEQVYQVNQNLKDFQEYEKQRNSIAHNPGPLKPFLERISQLQKNETEYAAKIENYSPRINISIVTARSMPAHTRVINTMREWDINVNQAYFLGGVEKKNVLEVLKPHIFFDDQKLHLNSSKDALPSVHVPFGLLNQKGIT
jgi:5'-nucleotidase